MHVSCRQEELTWEIQGQHDQEPKQCHEPLHPISKSEYFLLKAEDVHIEDVNSDNLGASRCEPASSRGAWNTSPFRVSDVTCGSDKIAEPMVISAQSSSL